MSVAVVLYLDPQAAEIVRGMWRQLADRNISCYMLNLGVRPHVSLAVYDRLEFKDARKRLADFAESISPFPLTLSTTGSFSGDNRVLFLGAAANEVLLRVHRDFHRLFERHKASEREYYLEGRWIPHCTLAERLPNELALGTVIADLQTQLPIRAIVSEIGIVEFRPVKELCTFALTGVQHQPADAPYGARKLE